SSPIHRGSSGNVTRTLVRARRGTERRERTETSLLFIQRQSLGTASLYLGVPIYMKTSKLVVLVLVILGTFVLCSSAQEVKKAVAVVIRDPVVREFNPAFKGKPEAEIETLEHQLADALRLKDASKLNALFAESVIIEGVL